MFIRKAYRYRLYPTSIQKQQLAINFDQARFVYNYFLAERKRYYDEHHSSPIKKGLNYYDNANALRGLKHDPEYEWLKGAHSQVLQQSLMDLDRAFQNFFAKRTHFPRFHSKKGKQTARYPQGVRVGEGWLKLPKIGKVKAVIHRPCEGSIKNVTVTRTKSGRYLVAVQVEMDIPEPQPITSAPVGIDLGVASFLVTSDGVSIAAPQYLLKAQDQLARVQKRLSRCQMGSHGREKVRYQLARQHERIANQRLDFLHKTSKWLVDTYGLIGIEDLNVGGMVRNRHLSQAISDAGWGELRRQVQYKGNWYGTQVVSVGRFFPSSRRCSACGHVLTELSLSVREWDCPECRVHHDRDLNAAINIQKEAQARAGTARRHADGEVVRPVSSWQPSLKSEAAPL